MYQLGDDPVDIIRQFDGIFCQRSKGANIADINTLI
jgi:hypothetical protein